MDRLGGKDEGNKGERNSESSSNNNEKNQTSKDPKNSSTKETTANPLNTKPPKELQFETEIANPIRTVNPPPRNPEVEPPPEVRTKHPFNSKDFPNAVRSPVGKDDRTQRLQHEEEKIGFGVREKLKAKIEELKQLLKKYEDSLNKGTHKLQSIVSLVGLEQKQRSKEQLDAIKKKTFILQLIAAANEMISQLQKELNSIEVNVENIGITETQLQGLETRFSEVKRRIDYIATLLLF